MIIMIIKKVIMIIDDIDIHKNDIDENVIDDENG
jgi:hypothetical protein